MNFIQSKADPCVFIKRDENGKLLIILAVYVDDTLIIGSKDQVEKVYQQLKEKFVIEILGALNKHLGIRWTWTKYNTTEIGLKAKMITLADDIINDYKEASGKEPKISSTPGYPGKYLQKNEDEIVKLDAYRSIVGKLIYYMTKIRPDLSNAVRDLSAHLTNPGKEHWKALDRCVGYVKTTKLEGIYLKRPRSLQSISYTDADYAKDEKDRKSISGRLNTVGGMITGWSSKKQNTVSLSSTEAEYQALSECAQEAMFTRNLIEEITNEPQPPAIIYEDNLGAIFLSKNSQVSARTKHIDVRHHFIRDLIKDKKLIVRFIKSEDNPSDIMTKNVNRESYLKHVDNILKGNLPCWREDVKSTLINTTTEYEAD
jgi:hypothetical protein